MRRIKQVISSIKTFSFIIMFGILGVMATFALSQAQDGTAAKTPASIQAQYIARLEKQGFEVIEVERTWLGRLRFWASADGVERELVVNRKTGEILRDYWHDEEDHEDDIDEFFEREDISDHIAWSKIENLAESADLEPEELGWELLLLGLAALEAEGEESIAEFKAAQDALRREIAAGDR